MGSRVKLRFAACLVGLFGTSLFAAPPSPSCGPVHTAKWLRDLIKQARPPIKTKKDLLNALPAEYRQYYTLMYTSESSQKDTVSPTIDPGNRDFGPRYIGFGQNGSLMIAMNGDPASTTIDISETDPTTGQISEMAEIDFRTGENTHGTKTELRPTGFSTRNEAAPGHGGGAKCTSCHGSPPVPIWHPYPLWPGAYGSVEDSLTSGLDEGLSTVESNRFAKLWMQTHATPGQPIGTKNAAEYERFPYGALAKPRPYCADIVRGCLSDVEQLAKSRPGLCPPGLDRSEPNESLNLIFGVQNAKRIPWLMKSDPRLFNYRYALVGAANCAGYGGTYSLARMLGTKAPAGRTVSSYIDPTLSATESSSDRAVDEIFAGFSLREREQLNRDVDLYLKCLDAKSPKPSECAQVNSHGSSRVFLRLLDMKRRSQTGGAAGTTVREKEQEVALAGFRYVIEGAAGSTMNHWLPPVQNGTYAFNDGVGGIAARLGATTGKTLLGCDSPTQANPTDTEICKILNRAHYRYDNSSMAVEYGLEFGAPEDQPKLCKLLETASLQALGAKPAAGSPAYPGGADPATTTTGPAR